MTHEELLAENLRLRARIRELEQENACLKVMVLRCCVNRNCLSTAVG